MKNSSFWRAVALVAIIFCLEVVKGKNIAMVYAIRTPSFERRMEYLNAVVFFHDQRKTHYENQILSALVILKDFIFFFT